MRVSGSSIAAYYVGNAALALDRQAAQQSQAAIQQNLQRSSRPQPLSEQVLEGELLNEQRQRQQAHVQPDAVVDEAMAQRQGAEPPLNRLSSNPAIRHYQSTALLDGFARVGSPHLVDIYV